MRLRLRPRLRACEARRARWELKWSGRGGFKAVARWQAGFGRHCQVLTPPVAEPKPRVELAEESSLQVRHASLVSDGVRLGSAAGDCVLSVVYESEVSRRDV